MASVWNPENVTDVAESVGIAALNREVAEHLARDVEYRISQVLEEALKFMRHAKRTTLTTQDISQALRVLDVEPLYGYESTRPLRFGEASIGPGQPLFYVEDEEVDFEKLINAPLPKVPREISFTGHWLAVEGVQPSIPQNPTQADQRGQELAGKGQGANTLAALSGNDNVAVKPLVKHVLSKELQLYFERICAAILDEDNMEYQTAAFASLRSDPGLHQLVPYFIQFIADKVTHGLKSLFILAQSMRMVESLLANASLYIAPYVSALIPAILTCVVGKHLGAASKDQGEGHYALRAFSSSLLLRIAQKYGDSSSTLKPRIARACLKHFLDSHKPYGTHYGAVLGLTVIAGSAGVRSLILPNLQAYDLHLQEGLKDDAKRPHALKVVEAIVSALELLEQDAIKYNTAQTNGHPEGEALKERLNELLGAAIAQAVLDKDRPTLVYAVLEKEVEL